MTWGNSKRLQVVLFCQNRKCGVHTRDKLERTAKMLYTWFKEFEVCFADRGNFSAATEQGSHSWGCSRMLRGSFQTYEAKPYRWGPMLTTSKTTAIQYIYFTISHETHTLTHMHTHHIPHIHTHSHTHSPKIAAAMKKQWRRANRGE